MELPVLVYPDLLAGRQLFRAPEPLLPWGCDLRQKLKISFFKKKKKSLITFIWGLHTGYSACVEVEDDLEELVPFFW